MPIYTDVFQANNLILQFLLKVMWKWNYSILL